jgi:hypothetical protein
MDDCLKSVMRSKTLPRSLTVSGRRLIGSSNKVLTGALCALSHGAIEAAPDLF